MYTAIRPRQYTNYTDYVMHVYTAIHAYCKVSVTVTLPLPLTLN